MKTALWLVASLLLCIAASAAVPSSINNDDSCDVKVGPAATLLLPYFEVDVFGNSGRTTLLTITNISRYPQIAHVTLWTDFAYPVLTFNLFLTGYDVQAINLADVLVRGTIAPPGGTSPAITPGSLSATSGNLRTTPDCSGNPAFLPPSIIAAVRDALTLGIVRSVPFCSSVGVAGGVHIDAVGYATIDVVANCTNLMPFDPLYYTTDLLFDNVLIGDYQQIGAVPASTGLPSVFDASGNPMVHIRAVPEGGGAGSNVSTALPYTFYDRYTPSATRTIDRRQPLPSTFAARYVQGSANAFATNFNVWREATTGSGTSCKPYLDNSAIPIAEIVRFDEHENAFVGTNCQDCLSFPTLPAASARSVTDQFYYPSLGGPDVAGWMYLNLHNGGSPSYSAQPNRAPRPSQNWVTISMFGTVAGNRMTAEFDAAPLGNGCSPAAFTALYGPFPIPFGLQPLGPAGGLFVCPPGTTLTNGTTALCTGTNANPIP
jgi:hypothetical protein